jgi:hypothetical protein
MPRIFTLLSLWALATGGSGREKKMSHTESQSPQRGIAAVAEATPEAMARQEMGGKRWRTREGRQGNGN